MKITLFLAVALFLQLWKRTRSLGGKGKPFHTWLGRITILVALGSIPHFTHLVLNFFHKTTAYAELPIVFLIPVFGIKGWSEIRNGDWRSHRASMIMFSACFYYFGVQRLTIALFGAIHHEKSPFAKYLPLGPWSQWNEDDYNEMFGIGICTGIGKRERESKMQKPAKRAAMRERREFPEKRKMKRRHAAREPPPE